MDSANALKLQEQPIFPTPDFTDSFEFLEAEMGFSIYELPPDEQMKLHKEYLERQAIEYERLAAKKLKPIENKLKNTTSTPNCATLKPNAKKMNVGFKRQRAFTKNTKLLKDSKKPKLHDKSNVEPAAYVPIKKYPDPKPETKTILDKYREEALAEFNLKRPRKHSRKETREMFARVLNSPKYNSTRRYDPTKPTKEFLSDMFGKDEVEKFFAEQAANEAAAEEMQSQPTNHVSDTDEEKTFWDLDLKQPVVVVKPTKIMPANTVAAPAAPQTSLSDLKANKRKLLNMPTLSPVNGNEASKKPMLHYSQYVPITTNMSYTKSSENVSTRIANYMPPPLLKPDEEALLNQCTTLKPFKIIKPTFVPNILRRKAQPFKKTAETQKLDELRF